MNRLPPPFKDRCRQYKRPSTQPLCRSECEQNITMSLCSCVTRITRYNLEMPQCNATNPNTRCCVAMSKKKADEICDCPLPCEETVYYIRASSSVWPSPLNYEKRKKEHKMLNKTPDFLSYKDFRETNLRLRVYYDTFHYNIYEQTPLYQRFEIFSQIGGHMGLWLGFSIAVIIESLISVFRMFRHQSTTIDVE